jgi:hypothetical protein
VFPCFPGDVVAKGLLELSSRLAKFAYIFLNPEGEICFKCAVSPRAEIGVDKCVDVLEGQSSSQHSMLIPVQGAIRQRAGEEHMLDL